MSTVNPYSFLFTNQGTWTMYDHSRPVVDNIADISIESVTNPDGSMTFSFGDSGVYQYMHDKYKSTVYTRGRSINPSLTTSDTNTKKEMSMAQCSSGTAKSTVEQNGGVMDTVREGYGGVPDKQSINNLTNNTGAYGGGVSSLVYPSDLITNQYGYNGCYTVLFISEHASSTIANVNNGFVSDIEFVKSAEGAAILEQTKNVDMDAVKTGVTIAVGSAGALGANALGKGTLGTSAGSAVSAGFKSVALAGAIVAGGAIGAVGTQTLLDKSGQYKQLNIAIALPTPALIDRHTLNWSGDYSTAVSGGIMEFLQGTDGIGEEMISQGPIQAIENALNRTNQRGQTLSEQTVENIKEASAAFLMNQSSVGKGGIMTGLARIAGKIANPRKEQLFRDVGFRNFSMSFDLAARSVKDMENIESIIRVLKYHAYPELTTGKFLWIYPAQFDIVHYFKDDVNTHMPRHATSVLTNITVDYGGGNPYVSVHRDGSPVNIRLTLEFQEIAVLSRSSIEKGY